MELEELDLSATRLSGELPLFRNDGLRALNVSWTQLRLPQELLDLVPDRSAFTPTSCRRGVRR